MSNQIVGNQKTLSSVSYPVNNSKAVIKQVSVNVKSFGNRKTEAKTLRRLLKGGFNWNIWNAPLVAELSQDVYDNEGNIQYHKGEQFLYDGDHRRHIYKLSFPNDQTLEANVCSVKDMAEISELFVKVNKTARKNLTAEEVFVHEVLGKMGKAVQVNQQLIACRLKVSMGTGEPNSEVGATNSPRIKITGFKDCIDENGLEFTKQGSLLIQSNWYGPGEEQMPVEFLRGLSYFLKYCPEVLDEKKHKVLNEWIDYWNNQVKSLHTSSKKAHSFYKTKGGSVVNKDELCITLGIMRDFKERSGLSNAHFSSTKWNERELELENKIKNS